MQSVFTPRATSLTLTAEQWATIAEALHIMAAHRSHPDTQTEAAYCRDLAEVVTASATDTEREPAPVRATRRRFAFRQADTVRLIQSLTESLLHQSPTEITLYEHPAVGRAEFMVDGSPAAFADEVQA